MKTTAGAQRVDLAQMKELVLDTGMFDPQWYAETYPDVQRRRMDPLHHYCTLGGRIGYAPGPNFDVAGYVQAHPELKYNREPALLHYALHEKGRSVVTSRAAGFTPSGFAAPTEDELKNAQWRYLLGERDEELMDRPSIVAIIPTAGKDIRRLDACLNSLHESTGVVLVVNGPRKEDLKERYKDDYKVVVLQGSFNWSVACNIGAKMAEDPDYYLFLNDDAVGTEKGWERKLLGFLHARVLSPVILHGGTDQVQSAGCYRVPHGCTSAHITWRPVRSYYVESVMGAAMMVERMAFVSAGGFDTKYRMIMAETDFCYRTGLCAVVHDVTVEHWERTTRGPEDPQEDIERFVARHPLPSARIISSPWIAGYGLRVLILKLDHIGDLSLAMRAVDTWQQGMRGACLVDWCVHPSFQTFVQAQFPYSTIHTFEFFKENASGGQASWDKATWERQVHEMPPYDIMIDLRAHGETRPLLAAWDGTGTRTFAFGKPPYAPYNILVERTGVHFLQSLNGFLGGLPLDALNRARNIQHKGVLLCQAASSSVKTWPREHWEALARALLKAGWQVTELDAPGAQPVDAEGMEHVSTTLDGIEPLIMDFEVYIGHDSGSTHIAAATGAQVIEIVGGLVMPGSWQGATPYATSITHPMPCTPCYHQPCKNGAPTCIQAVSVEDVMGVIKGLEKRGAFLRDEEGEAGCE